MLTQIACCTCILCVFPACEYNPVQREDCAVMLTQIACCACILCVFPACEYNPVQREDCAVMLTQIALLYMYSLCISSVRVQCTQAVSGEVKRRVQ